MTPEIAPQTLGRKSKVQQVNQEELIRLATETMKACRTIISALTAEKQSPTPQLVGLGTAGKMFGYSQGWLRKKLERGELTGYHTKPGAPWKVDPVELKKELQAFSSAAATPRKRRKRQLS